MSTSTLAVAKRKPKVERFPPFVYRLTVAQYHQMIEAGIVTDDDPVEFIDGCLVKKMSKKPLHRLVNRNLREALEKLSPLNWYVDSQEPVTTASGEPEPDIAVIRGKPRDYAKRHPRPKDLALVAEVADTSLDRDRSMKKAAYARAGIAVYWIVNLVDQKIEVYTDPGDLGEEYDYREVKYYGVDDRTPFYVEGRKVGNVILKELM